MRAEVVHVVTLVNAFEGTHHGAVVVKGRVPGTISFCSIALHAVQSVSAPVNVTLVE